LKDLFGVGLYCPPLFADYGGAQRYTSGVLSYLANYYKNLAIRVVADSIPDSDDAVNRKILFDRYGFAIESPVEFIESPGPIGQSAVKTWERHHNLRRLSADCGLFINCFHNLHYFKAGKNIHIVHFPAEKRIEASPTLSKTAVGRTIGGILDRRYSRSYDLFVCNSGFSRSWLERYWGIEAARQCVLYPPVDVDEFVRDIKKEKTILMCSRFDRRKKLLEAVRYFVATADRYPGWSLIVAGSVSDTADGRRYFSDVEEAAGGSRVRLVASPSPNELARLYATSSIFWHSMGLGVDVAANPLDVEHFGITTVEAMAAGAVPVVIDAGGQREIVEHGINGYLWPDLDALGDRTAELVGDDPLRRKLAAAAVERSARFSKKSFESGIDEIFAQNDLIPRERHR
jgi:glycosyltransferase involved in cell wall biosynthesis